MFKVPPTPFSKYRLHHFQNTTYTIFKVPSSLFFKPTFDSSTFAALPAVLTFILSRKRYIFALRNGKRIIFASFWRISF